MQCLQCWILTNSNYIWSIAKCGLILRNLKKNVVSYKVTLNMICFETTYTLIYDFDAFNHKTSEYKSLYSFILLVSLAWIQLQENSHIHKKKFEWNNFYKFDLHFIVFTAPTESSYNLISIKFACILEVIFSHGSIYEFSCNT